MVDHGWNAGTSLKVPFELDDAPANVSIGASTDRKDRAAFTRRFRFRPRGSLIDSQVRTLSPNELFGDSYIDPNGFVMQEATFRTDNYDALQEVDAAYAMVDFELFDGLRLSGGARVERSLQSVSPKDLWDVGGLAPVEGAERRSTDVLPAINATLSLGESMNLRAGASQTLARAQLRELAPFSFADYAGGYLVIGNPSLDRTRIDNYDLRLEWFGGPQTVFAVSTFYKRFFPRRRRRSTSPWTTHGRTSRTEMPGVYVGSCPTSRTALWAFRAWNAGAASGRSRRSWS